MIPQTLTASLFAILSLTTTLSAQIVCNDGLAIAPQSVEFGQVESCAWSPPIRIGNQTFTFSRSSCSASARITPVHQIVVPSPGSNQRAVLFANKPVTLRTYACLDTLFLGLFTMGVCTQTGSIVAGAVNDYALQQCPVRAKALPH